MDFIIRDIPKIGRGKYKSTSNSTTLNVGGSSSSGNKGLPYTTDINGNYIIENNVIINGDLISKGEVCAYGVGTTDLDTAPTSMSEEGFTGERRFCSDGIYICISTNTWRKVEYSTF